MDDQKTPEAPTPTAAPTAAPEVKITLDAKDKLADLKKRLEISSVVDPKKQNEIKEIEDKFNAGKEKILTISEKSIEALKADINDSDETLSKKLDVKDGELVFEAKAESTPATPETPQAPPTSSEVTAAVAFFKEVGEFEDPDKKPKENMILKWFQNIISGFIISIKEFFWQDVSNERAKLEWYKDALSKKKVDGMMNGLSPYMGWSLDKASVEKKEWLANFIEWAGVPLMYISENGQQRIMIAPQVMKYVFEWDIWKLPNILGEESEAWKNIQAARGKYLSRNERDGLSNISATERVKNIFTIEEEARQGYINRARTDVPINPGNITDNLPIAVPADPSSPEVQKDLMAQAIDLDKKVDESKTESDKKTAQEAVKKFQEERKNTILGQFSNAQKNLDETRIKQKTLAAWKPADGTEDKKWLDGINQDIQKLEDIQNTMATEINKVMTQIAGKWEIKSDANAEAMLSAEIAIRKIPDNIILVDTSAEKSEELTTYRKLLNTNKIISDSKLKEIQTYLEKSPNSFLQERLEVMQSKIELVKMTIKKKNEMKADNHFINWGNDDTDSRWGWVEIDDSYSGGSALEDISWLELDADGLAEVDWQLVRGDNYHVKRVWGLWDARNILNDNKDIIRNCDDPEHLKI